MMTYDIRDYDALRVGILKCVNHGEVLAHLNRLEFRDSIKQELQDLAIELIKMSEYGRISAIVDWAGVRYGSKFPPTTAGIPSRQTWTEWVIAQPNSHHPIEVLFDAGLENRYYNKIQRQFSPGNMHQLLLALYSGPHLIKSIRYFGDKGLVALLAVLIEHEYVTVEWMVKLGYKFWLT